MRPSNTTLIPRSVVYLALLVAGLRSPVEAQEVGFIEVQRVYLGPAKLFVQGQEWPELLHEDPIVVEITVPEDAPPTGLPVDIRVEKEGYDSFHTRVRVRADEVSVVTPTMSLATTDLRLVTLLPARADYRVERRALYGSTPADLHLPTNQDHVLVVDSNRFCIRTISSEAYVRIRAGSIDEVRGAETCEVPEPGVVVPPEIRNRQEILEAMVREYPPQLRDAGIGGTVAVYFLVSEYGTVRDFRIHESSGHAALDQAALAVANVFRFRPARNDGERVPLWVQFPITFQVR